MNPPVQPPCANPPSRSSPACTGAWITPSSDTYSTTTKLLTKLPSLRSRQSPWSADRGFSAWPDRRMVPTALKGFLANPAHRGAPAQREDLSHRNALLLCSQAASVDTLTGARAAACTKHAGTAGQGPARKKTGRRTAVDPVSAHTAAPSTWRRFWGTLAGRGRFHPCGHFRVTPIPGACSYRPRRTGPKGEQAPVGSAPQRPAEETTESEAHPDPAAEGSARTPLA